MSRHVKQSTSDLPTAANIILVQYKMQTVFPPNISTSQHFSTSSIPDKEAGRRKKKLKRLEETGRGLVNLSAVQAEWWIVAARGHLGHRLGKDFSRLWLFLARSSLSLSLSLSPPLSLSFLTSLSLSQHTKLYLYVRFREPECLPLHIYCRSVSRCTVCVCLRVCVCTLWFASVGPVDLNFKLKIFTASVRSRSWARSGIQLCSKIDWNHLKVFKIKKGSFLKVGCIPPRARERVKAVILTSFNLYWAISMQFRFSL